MKGTYILIFYKEFTRCVGLWYTSHNWFLFTDIFSYFAHSEKGVIKVIFLMNIYSVSFFVWLVYMLLTSSIPTKVFHLIDEYGCLCKLFLANLFKVFHYVALYTFVCLISYSKKCYLSHIVLGRIMRRKQK